MAQHMCVCVYLYTYTYLYISMYVDVYIRGYLYSYKVCIYIYKYAYMIKATQFQPSHQLHDVLLLVSCRDFQQEDRAVLLLDGGILALHEVPKPSFWWVPMFEP